jgi:hypothetical protein
MRIVRAIGLIEVSTALLIRLSTDQFLRAHGQF